MEEPPSVLVEVISVIPAMRPNWRSRGVAMEEAIVSGLAPGNEPETLMVGKSTCGSGDTGSARNATMPASATATVSNAVATGLRTNGAERFTIGLHSPVVAAPFADRCCPAIRALAGGAAGRSAPAGQTRDRSPGSYRASATG